MSPLWRDFPTFGLWWLNDRHMSMMYPRVWGRYFVRLFVWVAQVLMEPKEWRSEKIEKTTTKTKLQCKWLTRVHQEEIQGGREREGGGWWGAKDFFRRKILRLKQVLTSLKEWKTLPKFQGLTFHWKDEILSNFMSPNKWSNWWATFTQVINSSINCLIWQTFAIN